MTATLIEVWRYPVKGLRGERLGEATLTPAQGMPGDRRYAFAPEGSLFDPAAPTWQPKRAFLQLAKDPGLSPVHACSDVAAETVTLARAGGGSTTARPATDAGRSALEAFLLRAAEPGRRPGQRLVEAGITLSDTGQPWVSIMALPTLRALAALVGRDRLDPARFRGNLVIDGAEAWAELGWIGREISVGAVRLRITEPIGRCAATTVDPATGRADLDIPRLLVATYGHNKCGVYAEVLAEGRIAEGDTVARA